MIKRLIVAGAVALSFLGMPSASAEASDPGTMGSDAPVINGRVYGPADGLTVERGDFVLGRVGARGEALMGTMAVPGTTMVSWGMSYARSVETFQLRYTGTAFSKGDVYAGKRTIQVCYRYYRGTSTLSSRCANSVYSGGAWQSDSVQTQVWDSLIPGEANQTHWTYSRYAIDPNVI